MIGSPAAGWLQVEGGGGRMGEERRKEKGERRKEEIGAFRRSSCSENRPELKGEWP